MDIVEVKPCQLTGDHEWVKINQFSKKCNLCKATETHKFPFKMKKFEWVPLNNESIICDLGFCVWEIRQSILCYEIYLNGNLWHNQHIRIEGAKIMVENRMHEFVSGLVEIGND